MKPSNGKRPKTERKDYAVNGSNRRFKGVRMRKWGKWVAEVRLPNSRKRLWLGSYETPEMAARAYDAAVFCLRGPTSNFNFPDAPPVIPSAVDLTLTQIRAAAARYAHQVPVEDSPEVAGAEPVAGSVQPELQAEEKGEEAKPLGMDSAVLPESEDVFSSSLGEFSADCYFPVGRGGAGVDDILPGGAFYQSPRQWNF